MRCDEMRELAPDVALGIATGEERDEALRHLLGCARCRRLVDELAVAGDELLTLAPAEEPPLGFESRVVAALGLERPRRRRRLRKLAWRVAPAAAAALVTAVVLVSVYRDDRLTAERYRDTLETANGQYFQTERLRNASGERGGVVFGYQGSPSWLLVTVDPRYRDRVDSAELVTEAGRTIPLGRIELDPEHGSWGGAIPIDLGRVSAVRLLGERSGSLYAPMPHHGEWD